MLKAFDQVGWRNDHVPALLRAIADGAEDFTRDLYEQLADQGSVRPDAVPAVPFLLELARTAPHGRADLMGAVAYLAGNRDATAWDAVVARTDEVVALTADQDSGVRVHAYLTLSHCRATYPAAVLWRRWAVEEDPVARSALLLALGQRDPERAEKLLAGAVLGDVADEREAALLALHRAGLPLPVGCGAAVAEAFGAGADPGHPRNGAVQEVVAHTSDLGFVDAFLSTVVRPGSPRVDDGIWALAARLDVSRSAPARYLPLLRPVLDTGAALSVANTGGMAAAALADDLAVIAARLHHEDGPTHDAELAAHTLFLLGDPRWVAPVCVLWSRGGEIRNGRIYGPVEDDLTAAIAAHLTVADARVVRELCRVVAFLPHAAREVSPARFSALVPALRAALPVAPGNVRRALLAIGAATDEDVHALATDRDGRAAVEWCRRTGDPGFLDAWLRAQPDNSHLANRLWEILPAGAHLAGVAPAVRPLLTHADAEVRFAAAHVLHLAGETVGTRDRVGEGLRVGRSTARYAADLADASHEPLLRACLDDSAACLAAARALARLGAPREDLSDAVILGVTAAGRFSDFTVIADACRDLADDGARAVLRDLAERDVRVVEGGTLWSVVWRDEAWRDAVLAGLA